MDRHAATAAALAAWLERQAGVTRVYHPALASHPQREVAARQLRAGGGMLAFELAGGRAAGRAFIDALELPALTASLGSVFTMVVHPPSTTHRQLDDAALAESGITAGLLRASVGLEDLDDLVADFEQALAASGAARRGADVGLDHRSGRRAGAGGPLGALPIASPVATLARARAPELNPPARLGRAIWRLLTSVNFAVAQIIVLSLLAVIGMTIRQLPTFAFRSASDYVAAMAEIHDRYDAVLGVGPRERAGAAPGLPHLHVDLVHALAARPRDVDHRLHARPDAAALAPVERGPRRPAGPVLRPEAARPGGHDRRRAGPGRCDVLRRHRFKVREEEADGARHLYGDRHQYTKLATLLTHLGLILFIVAAAVTTKFGDEQPLLLVEGGSLTVQPIGAPGILVVKNLGFEAPGFLETGQARDFTTELAVYRNGQEIAHKTIRVNDPLEVEGYSLHENNFGPAPEIYVGDADGKPLWNGPVPFDGEAGGPAVRQRSSCPAATSCSSSSCAATPKGSRR